MPPSLPIQSQDIKQEDTAVDSAPVSIQSIHRAQVSASTSFSQAESGMVYFYKFYWEKIFKSLILNNWLLYMLSALQAKDNIIRR